MNQTRTSSDSAQSPVVSRGVRGAVTVDVDNREEVLRATRQMLALLIRRNGIEKSDVASATFTVTSDLKSEFPAVAARQLGWIEVPLLCGYEIQVEGSLERCVRVLIHWNTTKTQTDIHHVYLHGAKRLRPDLMSFPEVDFDELETWITSQMQEEM
ncbi:MAG: chorismate mutase [Planctomycetota bacterium]